MLTDDDKEWIRKLLVKELWALLDSTQQFKMQLDQIGIESGLYPDQAMKQTSAILELLAAVPPDCAEDAASETKRLLDLAIGELQYILELKYLRLEVEEPALVRRIKTVIEHSAKQ